MKNLLLAVAFSAFATSAFADGHKVSILHCGCTEAGDAMVYTEIQVSKNSKGHDNHVAGSMDACFAGYEDVEETIPVYVDFVRTGDDCVVEEGAALGELSACEGQTAELVCGAEYVH